MQRKERTEILIKSDLSVAKRIAETLEAKYSFTTLVEPQYGLTMLKMRESAQNSLFYLGEVLVTECKVMLENDIGVGVVIGTEMELAKYLAIIDAAFEAEVMEVPSIQETLQKEKQHIETEMFKKQTALLKTKVNFETMEV
ncbi:phosphonate C-P lyase system protein PhnG [Pseudogracilibacillus sp. SO10305]|uniref:phosphonate C-P lyase system protein PhnG n=1 Tax=Pseudogracilibacillus sp. SO10305 TaxID=3098292 RepID=UPI00300DCE5D